MSYLHTDKEMEAVPTGHVHLIKDGLVIHKDPRSFLPTYQSVPTFDEDTGLEKKDAKGEPIYRQKEFAPACNLKTDYLDKGWKKCQKNGNDLTGPKVSPKTAATKKAEKESADKAKADADELKALKAELATEKSKVADLETAAKSKTEGGE